MSETTEEMSETTEEIALPADERTPREKLAEGDPLSHTEKVDYIFEVIVKLEKLVDGIGPQLEAIASGPMAGMLGMFGLGK